LDGGGIRGLRTARRVWKGKNPHGRKGRGPTRSTFAGWGRTSKREYFEQVGITVCGAEIGGGKLWSAVYGGISENETLAGFLAERVTVCDDLGKVRRVNRQRGVLCGSIPKNSGKSLAWERIKAKGPYPKWVGGGPLAKGPKANSCNSNRRGTLLRKQRFKRHGKV